MSKTIALYKTNHFKPYIIALCIVTGICVYMLFKNGINFSSNKTISISIVILLIIIQILHLTLGYIRIINNKEQLIIQKEIFNLIYHRKKIIKPFDVELVNDLETDYFIGGNIEFLKYRFSHNKGLIFYNKNGKILYKIGISNKINAEKLFEQIN